MKDSTLTIQKGLARRYRKEKIFRFFGMSSIVVSFMFLCLLLYTIISTGLPAFQQTYMQIDVTLDAQTLEVSVEEIEQLQRQIARGGEAGEQAETELYNLLYGADYPKIVRNALYDKFPDVSGRRDKIDLRNLASRGAAYEIREKVLENPDLIGTDQTYWVLANDEIDAFMKGMVDRSLPEDERFLKDHQLAWVDQLNEEGRLEKRFNTVLFTEGASSYPEQAGLLGAIMGSFYTMLVTLLLSFPIGVAAAAYLEEFAPQNNKWVDIIEININNLAAVPSIVFGLLGLAVFINFFGVPRSTPLVGGLVLTLMTLPTIIIASRAAIKSVPPSIKEAAIGLGASPVQTLFQHTLPLAMPGILTGTIIGMAQALGETAPLLMIGMVSFVADVPGGITDAASVMPVQVYQWADAPQVGFASRTSAAIMVLLGFLITMNLLAIYLRKKFEKRW